MSEQERLKQNSLLMLLALVGIAFLSVYFVQRYNFTTQPKKNETVQGLAPTVEDLREIGIDVESVEVLATTSSQNTGGSNGKCTSGDKCDFNYEMAKMPVCAQDEAGGTMIGGNAFEGGAGVSVRLNANVEPFIVTTPQVLFQGSKYVEDSRKQISYDFPVYRDAQHTILDDEARRTCAPGVDCEDYDKIAGTFDVPYGVDTFIEVENADEGGTGGQGKTIIYSVPSLRSACPDVQRAKANPRKASNYGMMLDVKKQPPGEYHALTRSYGAIQCHKKNPNGSDLEEAKNFEMCITNVKPTDFVAAAVFEVEQWFECLLGNEDCRDAKVFSIKIDPLWGGQTKCAKPECSIRYLEYEYLKGVAPGDAKSQIPDGIDVEQIDVYQPVTESFYISTPCKMRVNKWGVHDIPCLWDISPYHRQYMIQKSGYMPLDETMPQTFDDYWDNGVMKELKRRSMSCV